MEIFDANGQTGGKSSNSPMRRQGSMRKVLHASEGSDSMLGVSAKILERSEPRSLPAVYYYNFFKEYYLMVEYNLLRKHLLPGLFVIPSAQSKFLWFGVIFVTSGLYKGGTFRFSVHMSKGFPDSKCPRVVFECGVFHPNIDEETMELDVQRKFCDWSKETNHIWQVINYVHNIFQSIDFTQSSFVNQKASHLYINNREEFERCVRDCVETSQKSTMGEPMNDDPHYFKFCGYNEKVHSNARVILSTKQTNKDCAIGVRKGYSWIRPGTVRPFSKPFF